MGNVRATRCEYSSQINGATPLPQNIAEAMGLLGVLAATYCEVLQRNIMPTDSRLDGAAMRNSSGRIRGVSATLTFRAHPSQFQI